MNKKKRSRYLTLIILFLLSLMVWLPLLFLAGGSLMGGLEIKQYLEPVLGKASGYASWSILPKYPTLRPYVSLLLDTPSFFVLFWNSVKLTLGTVLGQFIVGTPAAWWFARVAKKKGKILFRLYLVLMIMPFQVTMVSNYLVLNKMNLLDTHLGVILPAVFSTFPIFLMYRFFKNIPENIIEAAKIDGATDFQIFVRIGLPLGKSGIAAAMIMAFLETWNLVEQPMIFLKTKSLWPLSLFLPEISMAKIGIALAASVVTLLPALLVFLFGQTYLEQGISGTGSKE